MYVRLFLLLTPLDIPLFISINPQSTSDNCFPSISILVNRHRQVMNLETTKPIINANVFLAPSASIIGNVEVQSSASVWYGAVLRGDSAPIELGERSCVGDRAVIHGPSRVASDVTIEPGAVIDSAEVGTGAVIGAGSVLSPGVIVGAGTVVLPSSFLAPGAVAGDGEVWAGTPAQKIDLVSDTERQQISKKVESTVALAKAHSNECGKTYEQLESERLNKILLSERPEDYESHVSALDREHVVVQIQDKDTGPDREAWRKASVA